MSQATWEPIGNIVIGSDRTLYNDWWNRALPRDFYEASETDLRYEPSVPSIPTPEELEELYAGPLPEADDAASEEERRLASTAGRTSVSGKCSLWECGKFSH